jgi:hypothetical protein
MTEYKNKKIWVVSDVEDEAKDEAKRLAKIAGKKVGPWLTEAIFNAGGSNYPSKNEDNADISNELKKIIRNHDEVIMKLNGLQQRLAHVEFNIHPLPKKSFLDKFFR